jgi:DNA ligase-1
LQEILHIFNQLANTSGRNDKERILRGNKDNELFKFTLNFLYNPYILTGISAKKLNKKVKEKGITFYEFDEIANYIMKNNTGTDSNIATVQNFINIQPSEMKEFYSQVFTKSLKCMLLRRMRACALLPGI